MHRLTLRLTDKTLATLNGRAAQEGRTPSDLARHLVNLALDVPDAPKLNTRQNPKLKGL